MNNSANCSYGRSVICGSVRLFLLPGFADRPSQRFGGSPLCDVTLRRSEQFEADHEPPYRCRAQKPRIKVRVQEPFRMRLSVARRSLNVGLQRGIVVLKNEGAVITRRDVAGGAQVSGTQITGWIIGDRRGRYVFLDLLLPRTLSSMRRNEHPTVPKRVPATMRSLQKERIHARRTLAGFSFCRTAPATASQRKMGASNWNRSW